MDVTVLKMLELVTIPPLDPVMGSVITLLFKSVPTIVKVVPVVSS